MANKDRNKRSVRKARAEERARVEAAQAASQPAEGKSKKTATKAVAKQEKAKANKDKKPGVIARLRNYLGDVRSEMRRVVWPSKEELKSYSVAIVAMLIFFGVVIWLLDTGIVGLLAAFTSLRG